MNVRVIWEETLKKPNLELQECLPLFRVCETEDKEMIKQKGGKVENVQCHDQ